MGDVIKKVRIESARRAYAELDRARIEYERHVLDAVRCGATFSDLARALDITPNAVRQFVRRAQKRSGHEDLSPRA